MGNDQAVANGATALEAPEPGADDLARIRHAPEQELQRSPAQATTVLAVTGHPDDDFIGLGGLLKTLGEAKATVFLIVLCANDPARRLDAEEAALEYGIPRERLFLLQFPDGHLTSHRDEAIELLRGFRGHVDVVLTHAPDFHPDHQEVSRLVARTFGKERVTLLHFHIPQRVPEPFLPNTIFTFPHDKETWKLAVLKEQRLYESEMRRAPEYFDPVVHAGFLRLAGWMACAEAGELLSCGLAWLAPCPHCGRLSLAGRGAAGAFPAVPARLILQVCPCGHSISAVSSDGAGGEQNENLPSVKENGRVPSSRTFSRVKPRENAR